MSAWTYQAFALDIYQVRFGIHPEKTRLVIDLSKTADFRVFTLADPYRMVIDLPSFAWKAGAAQETSKADITSIRHGNLQPGISRIVFDMKNPIAIRSAFILPANTEKPNRLVVDFNSVDHASFETARQNVHGTLSTIKPSSFAYKKTSLGQYAPPVPKKKSIKPLIVIDPGHGGVDPGAIASNGVYEKKITLKLAKDLKKELEDSGKYRVMVTRETDVFIPLGNRVKFARKHNADLFISLHADTIKKRSVRGASIYTLSEKASDAQTAKLADQENRADSIAGLDLSIEDDEVANILVDLAMRDTMNQSNFFANALVDSLATKGIRTLENPHRFAGFAVLKAPDIPSILIEAGFLSNSREAQMLNTKAYRKKIIRSIKHGIDAYFKQAQKNQRI